MHWVFEARKRFGLTVLNYTVTSNHIHLLVKDTGAEVIPNSMQLIAARTAQEYNQRKGRQGAFWEDRYHTTAIDADEHLHRCLVYIDLNMVRAGAVRRPSDWAHSGYREIQDPPERYAIIDLVLCGYRTVSVFQQAHREWVREALSGEISGRDTCWTEAVAVGGLPFIEKVRSELGVRAMHRQIKQVPGPYILREAREPYAGRFAGKNELLRLDNSVLWDENAEIAQT